MKRHIWKVWIAHVIATILSGCGGGGNGPVAATTNPYAVPQTTSVRRFALSASEAIQPSVTLIKMSEKRFSRTEIDYVFQLRIQNGSSALSGLTVKIGTVGAGTTVIDGTSQIGAVAANAVVTSNDSITLRHDRTKPFVPDLIQFLWSRHLTLQGTAAIGEPLVNYQIQAKCADGSTGLSDPTTGRGSYLIKMTGATPCTLAVNNPPARFAPISSIALTDGNINVSPLTQALSDLSNSQPSALPSAYVTLERMMAVLGSPLAGDPVVTPFVPDGTGLDKNILDFSRAVALHSNKPVPTLALEASIARQCTTGITCFPVETYGQDSTAEEQEVLEEFYKALDEKLFNGALRAVLKGSFSEDRASAISVSAEKTVKYAITAMLKTGTVTKFLRDLAKVDGSVNRTVLRKVVTELVDGAGAEIFGVVGLASQKSINPLEILVGAFWDGLFKALDNYLIELVNKNELSFSIDYIGQSVRYGIVSFGFDSIVKYAISCSASPEKMKLCVKAPTITFAATEFGVMLDRMVRDAKILLEIGSALEAVQDAQIQGVLQEDLLQISFAARNDYKKAIRDWASAGMPDQIVGIDTQLGLIQILYKDIVNKVAAYDPNRYFGIDRDYFDLALKAQKNRIDNAYLIFVALKNQCLTDKASGQTSLCFERLGLSNTAPTEGLVGHWSFDNCDGRDAGPNALHGVVSGAPVCVAGKKGKALRLNGSSDWITVGISTANPTSAVTMSYWLHREGQTVDRFENYISKEQAFHSYLLTGGTFQSSVLTPFGPAGWGGAATTLPTLSDWVHYAFTYDNATRIANTYINGILAKSVQEADPGALMYGSPNPMYIGRNGSDNVWHVRGLLDEVRLYNRALTADEVKLLAR